MTTTVTFKRNKETKNTWRYEAPEGGAVSGSLYVLKTAAGPNPPEELTVQVTTPLEKV